MEYLTRRKQAFIIMEWIGKWSLPHKDCGGWVNAGPYATEAAAQASLTKALDAQYNGADPLVYAADDRELTERRHKIVAISLPPDLEDWL